MQEPIVIAGAGLAGVCAALGLLDHAPVLLADHETAESASQAAMTGLANPVMSRRANLAWRADSSLAALHALARDIGVSPLHRGLLRAARDWHQIEAFRARARTHPEKVRWSEAGLAAERWPWFHAPMGALEILEGVAFNIPEILRESIKRIGARGASVRHGWKLSGWSEDNDSVVARFDSPEGTRTMSCGRLLLCVGAGILDLPDMDRLKLHPVKGQLIRVTSPSMPEDVRVITGGPYMIPEGRDLIVGSSYEHEFDATPPRPHLSRELLEKATASLPWLGDATIHSEHAGIRVTVPDTRLPMVGPVPGSRLVWVISGLGSKGLLSAPMIGRDLAEWLNQPDSVPSELKIRTWKHTAG